MQIGGGLVWEGFGLGAWCGLRRIDCSFCDMLEARIGMMASLGWVTDDLQVLEMIFRGFAGIDGA